jgi:hypothetical protein
MITYTWTFPALDCAPVQSGLPDVVKMIHWNIRASEVGPSGSYFADVGAGTTLPNVDPQDFIPFDEITTGVAADWVMKTENITGVSGIYDYLAGEIERQKNPPIIRKTLVS